MIMCSPMKKCSRCKEIKLKTYFWRNLRVPDKLNAWCKDCHLSYDKHPLRKMKKRIYAKAWYKKKGKIYSREYSRNPEVKNKAWIYRHTKEAINLRRIRDSNYRKTWNQKYKARIAVKNAVRHRKILSIKNRACNNCGHQANAYHHHLGYHQEHWLSVIPLCMQCHHDVHVLKRSVMSNSTLSIYPRFC